MLVAYERLQSATETFGLVAGTSAPGPAWANAAGASFTVGAVASNSAFGTISVTPVTVIIFDGAVLEALKSLQSAADTLGFIA